MIQSLRLRLVCAAAVAVVIVSAAAVVMAPFEIRDTGLALPRLLEEPYQDLLLLVPLGLLAIVLSWTVSAWSLRPVRQASRSAAALGPDDLAARVSVQGLPSEIRPLVDAFNGTLDRLSDAYLSERRFLSDAAHGLRTPLAVLSLRVQRARDGAVDWEAIDRDIVGMSRLTSQLLDLARKDHLARTGDRTELRPVDLARMTREVAAAAFPLAEAVRRDIVVEAPDTLVVPGRPDDLRDMVRNLVDNALLHGRGTVSLRCGAEERAGDGRVVLSVEDEGAGVPPGLEAQVFDRFRKVDPVSTGHGLGLAIVRETVQGLGGRVEIRPGPGCRVKVELPLREAVPPSPEPSSTAEQCRVALAASHAPL